MRKSIFIALLVSGCFGEGPVPTRASGVDIVYFITPPAENQCSMARYIADVAIGSQKGYTFQLPYTPFDNDCGNNGGGTPQIDVPVISFGITSPGAMEIGTAGRSGMGLGGARAAVYDDAVAWTFVSNSTMGTYVKVVGPGGLDVTINPQMGFYAPVAMTADAAAFYVAGLQSSGSNGRITDVNDPQYPCCGPLGVTDVSSQIYAITRAGAVTTLPYAPKLNCQTLKTCMVSNSTSLVFTEYEQPGTASSATSISKTLKSGAAPTLLATIPRANGVPSGLSATDTMVAWTSGPSYEFSPYPTFCHVRAYDLTSSTGTELKLYDSTEFSCLDAAVDATHVYFAIVEASDDRQRMHGLGLGRVSLDGKTFESIRVGVAGTASGPRRVYLHGEDVYAVDPLVIARLPKSTFDGVHDF